MISFNRWGLIALFGAWCACYAPHPQPGGQCADGACPAGLVCVASTGTCELTEVVDASLVVVDGAIDAVQVDAGLPDAMLIEPVLVQQRAAFLPATDSLTLTLPAATTRGNLLVMVGGTPAGGLDGVVGGGATWTLVAGSFTHRNLELWYGVASGSNSTVTITRASGASSMSLSISEWAGIAVANPFDGAVARSGEASPATTDTLVTTDRDLILFAVADGADNVFGNPMPGQWHALDGIDDVTSQHAWYRVRDAAGPITPAVSETAGGWDAVTAGFRIAR